MKAWLAILAALAAVSGTEGATSAMAESKRAPYDPSSAVESPLRATFSPARGELEVRAEAGFDGVRELQIHTDGLAKPEVGPDVNEPGIIYLPPPEDSDRSVGSTANVENIYFFNELGAAPDWSLVMHFQPAQKGTWKLNGRFSRLGGALEPEVVMSASELEPGENLLQLRADKVSAPRMYWRRIFRPGEPVVASLKLTPRDWGGRIVLMSTTVNEDKVVAETVIAPVSLPSRPSSVGEHWWEDRVGLTTAALAVGQSLLGSRVRRPGSLFEDGFHLVYDPRHRSRRIEHWMWAWGPSIDLLLRLSKLEAAQPNGMAASFRAAALAAAKRTLQFEVTDPKHPAFGLSTVRWEPSRATPLGWAEYISTADSLFMAGWGWMSAYAETGDPEYLARMRSLVAAAGRLMDRYPVVPQDWIVERNRWTPHTLDESVFGTIGFRRLYEATGSTPVAAAGRRFLDSHLRHMGRESGLLARAWLRDESKDIWDPDIKGHAWVMEGYLDGYRLSGDEKYLQLAGQLAERVMNGQSAEGSWTYLFKSVEPGDLIDDKGTAIWAYLFYDLYKSTKDVRHLAAGRRALGWCLRHQYRGEDPNLDGAVLHENTMAYIRRRPMTILYTTTFFGQALLEELALPRG